MRWLKDWGKIFTCMRAGYYCLFLPLIVLSLTQACTDDSINDSRTFYMGVTPWPADFTVAEVNAAYSFINSHCDIVSHHFDDGIPYEEAYTESAMPVEFAQNVQQRISKTEPGKKILLSVSALNLTRKEKADYYAQSPVSDGIKNEWSSLAFNDSKVITAYIHYISWLIDEFNPTFVNYGVESNLATWNAEQFALYKDFVSQVYVALKTKYPSMPIFVSFMVDESSEGLAYASQLLPYTDYIGLSAYPYNTTSLYITGDSDPSDLPSDYFERFISLDETKPFVIAETGYIAQDLVIPAFSLHTHGTEAWQKEYLNMILALCKNPRAKFLIWFCHKDYDEGINTLKDLGLYQDLFSLWQDTGLTSENGKQRYAYDLWIKWFNKTKLD